MKKFLTLLLILFFFPTTVSAEVIQNFNSEITVYSDGLVDIKEKIDYDFEDLERHGIFRYIPTVSEVGEFYRKLEITPISVLKNNLNEPFDFTENSEQVYFKIGDPDKTISGLHNYEINYSVKNGQGNYEDHDEIYWNVTGNGWEIPINQVNFSLISNFGKITKADCFTGSFGSTEKNCQINLTDKKVAITADSLGPYEGLTIVVGFPANTFPNATLLKDKPGELTETQKQILTILFFSIITFLYFLLPLGLIIWYLKFKRKKSLGKPAVNFDIPPMTPAEVGIIDNFILEQNDVVATIFDLAIRKYIKIEEVKKEKTLGIFGGGKDYLLKKLKNSEGLEEHEKDLFNRLFESGKDIKISELKKDFYLTFSQMQKSIFEVLKKRGYYTKNPANQRAGFLVLGVFSLFSLNIFLAVVLFFFFRRFNGRTKSGDLMDLQVDGLKIFLKNMKRYYKFQANNLIVVEKYIPYAIALGFIDQFMEQIKVIYPDYHPSWYSGTGRFYALAPAFNSSMNSSITTKAPSSSSGFSGGSSGGGGGGGGGGSW